MFTGGGPHIDQTSTPHSSLNYTNLRIKSLGANLFLCMEEEEEEEENIQLKLRKIRQQ